MRQWKQLGTVAAAAVMMTGVIAAPASAHDIWEDICRTLHCYGYTGVTLSHTKITICDQAADNVGVSVEFWVTAPGGTETHHTISDGNGSASPCNSWTATGGGVISSFRGYSADGQASTGWINA